MAIDHQRLDRIGLEARQAAEAREKGVTPEQQALVFLKTQGEIWKKWLPADVAGKVAASL